jgi:hypothetical protein
MYSYINLYEERRMEQLGGYRGIERREVYW